MNKAEERRLKKVFAAVEDEIDRLNKAIADGKDVIIPGTKATSLAAGEHIARVNYQMEVYTKEGGWWCYCNGPQWAEILTAAGVARNPLFK